MALKKSQRSLKSWTKQKWRTKSGKKSSKTGERYLPSAAIAALTPAEYAATSRKNIEGFLKPIPDQLEALDVVEVMINNEEVTLRDAAYWLENKTGRYISHVGLKNYIDKRNKNEREIK